MQIVLHAGAHFTDEDRLVKCLLKNTGPFADLGVAIPGPSHYRRLLKQSIEALSKGSPSENARDILVEEILEDKQADRMVLSNQDFFGVPKLSIAKGQLYPLAERRLEHLKTLFPPDQIELFMAVRDPATFLPTVFHNTPAEHFSDFMDGHDPRDIRWSDLVNRIRDAHPDIALTLWCNEDTPLIWAQIIREMAMLEPNRKIKGGFDLLAEIMTRDGMKRFRAYLKEHPVMTEMQKRRVISAFLDKFAREDMIEEELDVPGWTDDLIAEISDGYDEDVYAIQRIPGVNFIAP